MMKTQGWIIEDGGWNRRSVMECGGPPPLSGAIRINRWFQSARGLAQSKTWRHFVVLTLLALSTLIFQPSIARAQQYSIDWYKIAGGGGTSTGGTYQVSGTIGQHDAGGPMTGGNYSLTGGFWALISVVQTPGAPTLFISHASNTVTVYWQDVPGWALQQNGNLASSAGWSASSGATLLNGTNYLNLTSPPGNLFFRLKQ